MNVEPEKIDEFTSRIDLRLMRGLALVEHSGGVQRISPCGRQQLSGAKKYFGAIFEACAGPIPPCLLSRGDGGLNFPFPRLVPGRQYMASIMRYHRAGHVPSSDFLSSDNQRNFNFGGV